MQEGLHIVEVRNHTHGDPHRAAVLAVDTQAKVVQRQAVFMAGACKTDIQLHARDAECDLPRAGVAEAARSQGYVHLAGFTLDHAMVNGLAVFIEEIDGHRAAARPMLVGP